MAQNARGKDLSQPLLMMFKRLFTSIGYSLQQCSYHGEETAASRETELFVSIPFEYQCKSHCMKKKIPHKKPGMAGTRNELET